MCPTLHCTLSAIHTHITYTVTARPLCPSPPVLSATAFDPIPITVGHRALSFGLARKEIFPLPVLFLSYRVVLPISTIYLLVISCRLFSSAAAIKSKSHRRKSKEEKYPCQAILAQPLSLSFFLFSFFSFLFLCFAFPVQNVTCFGCISWNKPVCGRVCLLAVFLKKRTSRLIKDERREIHKVLLIAINQNFLSSSTSHLSYNTTLSKGILPSTACLISFEDRSLNQKSRGREERATRNAETRRRDKKRYPRNEKKKKRRKPEERKGVKE